MRSQNRDLLKSQAMTIRYTDSFTLFSYFSGSPCLVTILGSLFLFKIHNFNFIKTHGSESRGQEEAGLRDEPVSYLQVALL